MVQVTAEHLSKVVRTPSLLTILEDIHISVKSGESLAIVGPSGSGKTTLLGLLAGLDVPTTGTISWDDESISALSEEERAKRRLGRVGFVFQNFQLLPHLTAFENVSVALELYGDRTFKQKAEHILERVGLNGRFNHYPRQLSGGEQQRVAIARAYVIRPLLLFADEPTGNLDWQTAQNITALLKELHAMGRTTLIVATHSRELAATCHHMLELKQGHSQQDSK